MKIKKKIVYWLYREDIWSANMCSAFGFYCIPFTWYDDFRDKMLDFIISNERR